MNALRGVAFACALLASAAAQADDVKCDPAKDINDCLNSQVFVYSRTLQGSALDDASAGDGSLEVASAANEAVEEKDQPGTASAGAQTASAFTDLIPWANMLGLLSDSDESDGTIALDLNFLLGLKRTDVQHDSQLKWEFDVSPTLFDPLAQAIPEDVRDERSKDLQKKIGDTADSTLQYTYSFITKSFGRDFKRHQKEFASLIAPRLYFAARATAAADVGPAFDAKRSRFAMDLANLLDGMRAEGDARGFVKPQTLFGALDPREQDLVLAFLAQARSGFAQDMAKHLDALKAEVASPRIEQIADLVLKQPQLLFTATRSIRDELVGPESWGAKVTYEQSFVDFNGFRKHAKQKAREAGIAAVTDWCAILDQTSALDTAAAFLASDQCLEALDSYVDENAEQIENDSRWTASLEYKQVDDWRYALPDDGVDLNLPKHDRLIASAGFGRAIKRSTDRVDFEAAYDSNMGDDDTYNSRFVVTLTYTRRIMDMDMPISIVYANKSEFLNDTDKQIGLHIGIKYRALDKEK